MSRNLKKKKLIEFFINFIRHDYGFYNPIWKWNSLPKQIKDNYDLLQDKLQEWEEKGHVKVFMIDGEIMIEIFSVPEN